MIRGASISLIAHAAVVFASAVAWPHVAPGFEQEEVIVPIDLVAIDPVTNIAPAVRREPEPEPVDETPPPIEDFLDDIDTLPEDAPPSASESAPPPPSYEQAAATAIPAPVEDVAEAPDAEEQTDPPEPQRPQLSQNEPEPDPLESLLSDSSLWDRASREPKAAPPPPAPRKELTDTPVEPRRAAGERTGNTARIESIIVSQMKLCWDTVDDLPNPERLRVTVKVHLRPDGTLARDVELISPSRPPLGDRFMRVAIDRALTATRKCAPYQLPAEDYDEWKEVTMNIGPVRS